MTEQLVLIAAEPKTKPLAPLQQAVLDFVTRAGREGVTAAEAGAFMHSLREGRWFHEPDRPCDYCSRDGNTYLKRLHDLGHVRYRRARGQTPGGWVVSGETVEPLAPGMLRDDQELPF